MPQSQPEAVLQTRPLGWQPRPCESTMVQMAESLIGHKLV